MINLETTDQFIWKKQLGNRSESRKKHFRGMSAVLLRDYFFKLCNDLEIELLIEVGAHSAEASVRFMEEKNRMAVAFEANPFTFEEKTRKAESHGVIVRNEGVSSQIGTADFYIPNSTSNHSMPENASFRRKSNSETSTSVLVKMTTIDRVIDELPASGNIGLWIDAEGFALEVLQGGSNLLQSKNCQVVMVEVELKQYWIGQAQLNEVENFLQDNGYFRLMMDFESEFQRNLIFVKQENYPRISDLQAEFVSKLLRLNSKYFFWRLKKFLVLAKLKSLKALRQLVFY